MYDERGQDVNLSLLERYSLGPLGYRYGIPFALGSTTALATGYVYSNPGGAPFIFFVPIVGMSGYLGGLIPGLVATACALAMGFAVTPDDIWAQYATQITTRAMTCTFEGVLSAFLFHRLQIVVSDLKRSNRVAEVLRSELNHRVGNFLQNVLSYCYMQKMKKKNGEAIEAIIEKLNALGQVHHILQTGAESFGADVVTQVTASVLTQHSHQVDVDPRVRLTRDQVQPLMLILNELASNTAKHCKVHGTVHVRIFRQNGHCVFVYCDGGEGCLVPNKGLGMRIIEGLTEQLQGEVVFANAPKAKVTFPVS